MPSHNRKKLLTTREIAAKLSVHPKLVLRWVKNLDLPCYRFAKEYRFDELEVDEWIAKHKHENTYFAGWFAKVKLKSDRP